LNATAQVSLPILLGYLCHYALPKVADSYCTIGKKYGKPLASKPTLHNPIAHVYKKITHKKLFRRGWDFYVLYTSNRFIFLFSFRQFFIRNSMFRINWPYYADIYRFFFTICVIKLSKLD